MVTIYMYGIFLENNFSYGQRFSSYENNLILKKRIFMCFVFFLLMLAILREGIGTDYNIYKVRYEDILNNSYDLDLGFLYIMRLFRKFGMPYQMLIILFSFLNIIPLYIIWNKISDSYIFLSLGLYIGLGYYALSFNLYRQYAAMSLLLLGLVYLQQKRYLFRSIVLIVCAISFHSAALIAFPLLLLTIIWKPEKRIVVPLSAVVLLIFIFVPSTFIDNSIYNVMGILANISVRYSYYLNAQGAFAFRTYNQGLALLPTLIFIPSLFLLTRIFCDKQYESSDVEYALLKMYYIYLCIISFKMGSEMIDRFLAFFSITQIFVLPIIVKYVRKKYSPHWALFLQIFFIGTTIFMLFRYMGDGAGGSYPYLSIFSR